MSGKPVTKKQVMAIFFVLMAVNCVVWSRVFFYTPVPYEKWDVTRPSHQSARDLRP